MTHPIAEALRKRRMDLGMTQKELSEKMGYGQNTLWAWEVGRSFPAMPKLQDWLDALDMELVTKERGK